MDPLIAHDGVVARGQGADLPPRFQLGEDRQRQGDVHIRQDIRGIDVQVFDAEILLARNARDDAVRRVAPPGLAPLALGVERRLAVLQIQAAGGEERDGGLPQGDGRPRRRDRPGRRRDGVEVGPQAAGEELVAIHARAGHGRTSITCCRRLLSSHRTARRAAAPIRGKQYAQHAPGVQASRATGGTHTARWLQEAAWAGRPPACRTGGTRGGVEGTMTADQTRPPAGVDLGTIRALTFDVGGTVFDWHGTIRDAVQPVAQARGVSLDAARFANAWRGAMLAMVGQVRAGDLPWMTADELHRRALDDLLPASPLAGLSAGDRDDLTHAWHRLRAWPDAAPALERLRRRYTVVVLSILNFSLLVDSSKHAGITWDGIISCEFIGRYKDDPLTYQTAVRWLGLQPGQVMMVAAHPWDLQGALRVGLRSAYVPRPGEWGEPETRDLTPDAAIDLAATDFPDLATRLGT